MYEHLLLYARIKGIPSSQIKDVVNQNIIDMNLEEHKNKTEKQLSGGNKRKLAVAIAFTGNPRIVFLDEPSTGMDPVIRRKMWTLISNMKEHKVIILTTHSMEEAGLFFYFEFISKLQYISNNSIFLFHRCTL